MASKRVGIRELRQRASELVRRVARGETIEVTHRGEPVALLTPIPAKGAYERLMAAGEFEPATGDIRDLEKPLRLEGAGLRPASAALARLREHER